MMYRYITDNALGPTDSSNEFAALNRTQEPPTGSRLNHIPDPEVHEVYRRFVHNLRRFS